MLTPGFIDILKMGHFTVTFKSIYLLKYTFLGAGYLTKKLDNA